MCLGGRFLQKYAYKHPTPCCTLHLQALYTFQPKLLHARGRGWGARTGGTKKSSKPRVWFKFITDPTQQGISPPSGVKEREEETSYSYCTPSQQSTLVLLLHTQVHIQEKWVHWPLRRYALSRVLAGALFIQTNKQSPQKQGIKLFFFFFKHVVRVATEREKAVSSPNLSETRCQPPHPLTPHPTCWGRIWCEVHLREPSVVGGGGGWGR